MKNHISRRALVLSFALSMSMLGLGSASALASNKRPIRLLVGFPAGATVDLAARLIATDMAEALGTPVIVENRPGASGRMAISVAAAAASDGSTFIITPGAALTLFPHIFKELRYDPFKDLTPVTNVVDWGLGLAVPFDSPVQNLADYISAVKKAPDNAFFTSSSTGSVQHLAGMNLSNAIGAKLEHVGYKGASEAIVALVGNQVPAAILNIGDLINHHRARRVRVIAVLGKERDPMLPEIPSISELGYPQLVASGWLGLYAPAGTPDSALKPVRDAVINALNKKEIKAKLYSAGMIAHSSTPQELDRYGREEYQHWRDVVAAIPGFELL